MNFNELFTEFLLLLERKKYKIRIMLWKWKPNSIKSDLQNVKYGITCCFLIIFSINSQDNSSLFEECKQKLEIINYWEETMAEFKITKEKLIERYTKEMKVDLIKG